MRPGLWPEVESTLAAVIELPESERGAFLSGCCADAEVRAEVESLLAAYGPAKSFLNIPGAPSLGDRFGPYRLIRELGRGGMGSVFLAERDDGQFQKLVAIKIVAGAHSLESLRRFRSERQILAALDHPNIARLLDSGVSKDGLPFIVMEYVQGTPLTEYCRPLPFQTRLDLFRTVCAAAHFAHQHLVVHRDIKPGNILVTGEGVPKLLDFGIAKILDPPAGGADPTIAFLQPLTPDYASPEQLRGAAVSTASDVYSLGVLLFELLSGERPYRLRGKTLDEALDTISSQGPRFPATVPSDLAYIVRKAMRREPEARYASASELSADIDRHLSSRPVLARRGTFRYVTQKFVARHRSLVAAAVVAVLFLIAGAAALIRSSRIAGEERAKAQQRFDQVRQLANSLVFEIHDGVANLPGSTPVRKAIVSRALQYLDTLEKVSSGDIALELELARSYQRLASVQGNPGSSNLGDLPGAFASYGHAIAVLERLPAAGAERRDVQYELAQLYDSRGDVSQHLRQSEQQNQDFKKALDIAERLAARFPDDEQIARIHSGALFRIAGAVADANPDAGLQRYTQCLAVNQKLLDAHPENPNDRRNVALVHKYMANLIPSTAEALGHLRRAQQLDEARLAAHPDDRGAELDLSFDLSDIGWRLERSNDLSGALEAYQKVSAIRQELAAADPHDAQVRQRLTYIRMRVAGLLGKMGRLDPALREYTAANALAETAMAASPGDRWNRSYAAQLQLGIASTEAQLASHAQPADHRRRSCEAYRRASRILDKLAADGSASDEELKSRAAAREGLAACGAP